RCFLICRSWSLPPQRERKRAVALALALADELARAPDLRVGHPERAAGVDQAAEDFADVTIAAHPVDPAEGIALDEHVAEHPSPLHSDIQVPGRGASGHEVTFARQGRSDPRWPVSARQVVAGAQVAAGGQVAVGIAQLATTHP